MKSIDLVRDFIKYEQIDYLLVNSTNKFLVEYNTLDANSRYKLTGFSGSTGDALVSSDKCFLFVDGRYHIQADLEVDHSITDVVKLQTAETFLEKIVDKVFEGLVCYSSVVRATQKNKQRFLTDI